TTSWQVIKLASQELFDKQFVEDGTSYLLGARASVPDSFQKLDYLPQPNIRFPLQKAHLYVWNPKPLHDYDSFFFKVGEICRSRGLNCIYEHGLVLKSIVEQNPVYIENLGNLIEQQAGIKVIRRSPVEIPDSDIGNSLNHVRPEVRS